MLRRLSLVCSLALAAPVLGTPGVAHAAPPETSAETLAETEADRQSAPSEVSSDPGPGEAPTPASPVAPARKLPPASATDPGPGLEADEGGSPAELDPKAARRVERKQKWRFSLAPPRRVGIETSILWPAYPGLFFHLKSTVPIHAARGEVLLGMQGRVPQRRPAEGTFSNLDAVLGWRQYIQYGFHIDAMLNLGWGRLRNSPTTGRDYDSFDIELMALAGWRFATGPLYFAIQPLGVSNILNRTNPWPIAGQGTPRTEGPIYVGNVLFGVQF